MIASDGLLNLRRCCSLRLEGNSQVGIMYICVSFDERIMPLVVPFFTSAYVCLC
jgi:hypothetical protein